MLSRRKFGWGAGASVGAISLAACQTTQGAAASTASLTVLYPNHEGSRFDLAYYRATHIPLVMQVMQAESVMLTEGVPNGAALAPFVMMAHFQFATPEALQAALAKPEMAEVRADIATYTDIRPTIMLGKPA